MAKVAGGIDTTVRFIETLIETLPTVKFRNTARKEMPIRERDVRFIEGTFLAVQAETNALLAQLATAGRSSF
jgi:hypothetical protein